MAAKIPLISVIIPFFNSKLYIDSCLDSLLIQPFDDYEVILIDDFSTDDTYDYLLNTRDQDRFVILKNNEKGANPARQLGVRHAKGKYILFSDADDTWTLNAFESITKIIDRFRPDMIIGNMNYIAEDGSKIKCYIKLPQLNDPVNIYLAPTFINSINPNAVAKLFSKKILQNLTFKNVYFSQDWNITYKAILNTKKICFLDTALYNYIRRENSITNSSSTYKLDRLIFSLDSFDDILKYLMNYLGNNNKNLIHIEYNILHIKYLYNFLAKANLLSPEARNAFHREVKERYRKYHSISIKSALQISMKSIKYSIMLLAIYSHFFYENFARKFLL